MSDVYSLVQGVDFDTTACSIKVRADRIGADVYGITARGEVVRVLAHDKEQAEAAAREWLMNREAEAP